MASDAAHKNGKVYLFTGPMFSRKTKTLLCQIERYELAGKKAVVLKPSCDTRDARSNLVVSHDGRATSPAIQFDGTLATLDSVVPARVHVVGIDEGQFVPDLRKICEYLSASGVIVIVAALSGTHDLRIWPAVADLLPICNKITHLTAVCVLCGESAAFSKRLTAETADVVLGSREKYAPTCGTCHALPADVFKTMPAGAATLESWLTPKPTV